MEDDACASCCLVRLLMLPVIGLLYGQRRVNHRIRHAVHHLKPNLSERARDMEARRRELDLDHMELKGQCCVCRKQGARVAGRGIANGGLTVVDETDYDELSSVFGVPVRGYLCPTCLDVAVQIRLRKALGGGGSGGGADAAGGRAPLAFGPSGPAAGGPRREAPASGGPGADPRVLVLEVPAGDDDTGTRVLLPAWAVAAALDTKCEVCQTAAPAYFHGRHAELLCRRCVAMRGQRRLAFALGFPMPDSARYAVEMKLHASRPPDPERPSATRPAPRSLFAGHENNLFAAEAGASVAAGTATSSGSSGDASSGNGHRMGVSSGWLSGGAVAPGEAVRLSQADFEEDAIVAASATSHQQRKQLRRTGLSLFAGRKADPHSSGLNLFSVFWPATAADAEEYAAKVDLRGYFSCDSQPTAIREADVTPQARGAAPCEVSDVELVRINEGSRDGDRDGSTVAHAVDSASVDSPSLETASARPSQEAVAEAAAPEGDAIDTSIEPPAESLTSPESTAAHDLTRSAAAPQNVETPQQRNDHDDESDERRETEDDAKEKPDAHDKATIEQVVKEAPAQPGPSTADRAASRPESPSCPEVANGRSLRTPNAHDDSTRALPSLQTGAPSPPEIVSLVGNAAGNSAEADEGDTNDDLTSPRQDAATSEAPEIRTEPRQDEPQNRQQRQQQGVNRKRRGGKR